MRTLSRARFLRLAALSAPAWALSRRAAWPQPPAAERDADRRARLASLVRVYDSQGIHRTATPVDSASADWLRRLAMVAGADARLAAFALEQVDVRAAYLDAGGRRIDGLPFFDGGFTGDTGILGPIGPAGSPADIALVTLDRAAIGSEGQSIAALRRNPAQRAIVAITDGESPGLTPSNAVSFGKPYGPPVLQVASEHAPFLNDLAANARTVTLVAAAAKATNHAFNVVATVAGRQPALPPLVVMTPRSGWWQCASERGGGLACWMEALRAVHAANPPRTAIFVATSGHELGHTGLEAFLRERPALVKDAAAWIHLGANIGARGGRTRLQSSGDRLEARMLTALEHAGARIDQRVPIGTVPGGEARNIHVGGGQYVSLIGSGPRFHSASDRWPDAVDLDAVSRFSRAVSDVAVALATATAG